MPSKIPFLVAMIIFGSKGKTTSPNGHGSLDLIAAALDTILFKSIWDRDIYRGGATGALAPDES